MLDILLKKSNSIGKRVLDIGFGNENQSKRYFLKSVDKANEHLKNYNLFLNVKETIDVRLPKSFKNSDFAYGVSGSFSEKLDYYFVWSNQNFNLNNGEEYVINVLTPYRTCLINDRFKTTPDLQMKSLDNLIAQEALRLFVEPRQALLPKEQEYFYRTVKKSKVLKKIKKKKFKKKPFDLTSNLDEPRIITINVGLDGVSEKQAGKILKTASNRYSDDFNISFSPVDFYEHRLPKSWNTFKQLKKVKKKSKEKSDIFLLFTDSYWRKDGFQLNGQANQYYGYSWVSTYEGNKDAFITTIHEIGHLFDADHVYNSDAIMQPYAYPDRKKWMPIDIEKILKNKMKKWIWS